MNEKTEDPGGFQELVANLRHVPARLREAFRRHGAPASRRARSQAIFGNVFLHIHSVRIHRWTLRKTFTFGLGIACTALFGILVVTGLALMVYYKPSAAAAYDSVKDIHYVVAGGRLIRNMHRWAAHMMVACVFLHMARVVFTASYRKPREGNWLIGIGLLVLTLILAFTGYCLPWDQLGFWATTIGANIGGSPTELLQSLRLQGMPDVGDFQRRIILGSRLIGESALVRFYFFHCVLVPLALTILVGVHFWRIRKDGGLSRPDDIRPEELAGTPADELEAADAVPRKTYGLMCLVGDKTPAVDKNPEDTVSSWPHLFIGEMTVVAVILLAVVALGLLFNAPLSVAADPMVPENPAKAPWYFLGLQECVSYSAFSGGILIPTLVVIALGLLPFLDRGANDTGRLLGGPGERKVFWGTSILATAAVVGLLAFTIHLTNLSRASIALARSTADSSLIRGNWLRYWWPDLGQIWIIICNPGTVLFTVFAAYSLIILLRSQSVRLGVVAFFTCFVVSFVIMTYFAAVHRGPNWEFYWWPSQWPTH